MAIFDGLDGLTNYFRVEIFDITGRRVRTVEQVGRWDGKDDFGQVVESGVYLYQVHIRDSFNDRTVHGLVTIAK